jgi:hypothetical protein
MDYLDTVSKTSKILKTNKQTKKCRYQTGNYIKGSHKNEMFFEIISI